MPDERIFCPGCGQESEHTIIKSGQEKLVKCRECGTAHSLQEKKPRLASIKVVVNRDGLSEPYQIKLPADEELKVGADLVVDDESRDVVLTEITSLETDRRVKKAHASEVKTVWTRAVDEVALKISVYRDGKTQALKMPISGEEIFEVGETLEAEGVRFQISKMKLRSQGFSDSAQAKDIQRIWGRRL